MKGYYKGELRPCECGEGFGVGYHDVVICDAKRCLKSTLGEQAKDLWNNRPMFDKAIDALIRAIITRPFYDDREESEFWVITDITGLSKAEAVEIYKQRQTEGANCE